MSQSCAQLPNQQNDRTFSGPLQLCRSGSLVAITRQKETHLKLDREEAENRLKARRIEDLNAWPSLLLTFRMDWPNKIHRAFCFPPKWVQTKVTKAQGLGDSGNECVMIQTACATLFAFLARCSGFGLGRHSQGLVCRSLFGDV